MRTLLTVGSFAAVLLAGTGCRSHTAGRCDCTNNAESAVIPAPAANYPVIGGGSTSAYSTPTSIAPNGVMGGSTAPTAMPATMPMSSMPR